jgi:hypothetical protein
VIPASPEQTERLSGDHAQTTRNTGIKWGTVTDFSISRPKHNLRGQDSGQPHGLKMPLWALTAPVRSREIVNELI